MTTQTLHYNGDIHKHTRKVIMLWRQRKRFSILGRRFLFIKLHLLKVHDARKLGVKYLQISTKHAYRFIYPLTNTSHAQFNYTLPSD